MTEAEKLAKIGRQAMNIQMIEAVMKTCNSDGEPIDGTEHSSVFIYNLEKITTEEVEHLLNIDGYAFDPRILQTTPDVAANIFPHSGESEKDEFTGRWLPHIECSICNSVVTGNEVLRKTGKPGEYVRVKYRFCPYCGSPMAQEQEREAK